jgi:hypothetical protein
MNGRRGFASSGIEKSRPQFSHDVESVATRQHDVEDDAAIPGVEREIQRVIRVLPGTLRL